MSNSSFSSIRLGPYELDPGYGQVPSPAKSAAFGAALALVGPSIRLVVVNCSFENNFVRSGSSEADGYTMQGVAIHMSNTRFFGSGVNEDEIISSSTIRDSRFRNNTGFGGQAAIRGNAYYGDAGLCAGAGVFLDGLVMSSISFSSFTNNSCYGGAGGTLGGDAQGGAVSINFPPSLARLPQGSSWTISDCIFLGNSLYGGVAFRGQIDRGGSHAYGGAVFLSVSYYDRPVVFIRNSIFSYNCATGGSYGDANGGAVAFVFGSTSGAKGQQTRIANTTMEFNFALGGYASGGAISFIGDLHGPAEGLHVEQSRFRNNQAVGGIEGATSTSDAYKRKPRCRAEGGAVNMVSFSIPRAWDALSVSGSEFSNNSAIIETWVILNRGGLDYGEGEAYGGALRLSSNMYMSVHQSILIDNHVLCVAGGNPCGGGALAGSLVFIYNSFFLANSVISAVPSELPPGVNDVVLKQGVVATPVRGGAVYADNVHLESSSFHGNVANGTQARAGALYTSAITSNNGCNFSDNAANSFSGSAAGGAIYVQNDNDIGADVVLSDFIFAKNRAVAWRPNDASYGGAIHTFMDATHMYVDTIFRENRADFGAAIDVGQMYKIARFSSAANFINNTASVAGGAIMVSLNDNIDRRISFEPVEKNITYSVADISRLCNGTIGNTAEVFGSFCGLTIDKMVLVRAPLRYVWPGKLFKAVLKYADMLGNTVISSSSLIEAEAVQDVFAQFDHDSVDVENNTINAELAHAGILHVDNDGFYSFADLRLHSAPGSNIRIRFSAVNGPGVSQFLFPTYQNTQNHTFAAEIHSEVTVALCPPGFTLEKLSGGTYDCAPCPAYTYSLGGEENHHCHPCGGGGHEGAESPASMACLISPSFESDDEKEIWVIPKGFFPIPSFHEAKEILHCPNPSACKQYNCTIQPHTAERLVKWNLDCTAPSGSSYCEIGYTDRLCSRCACNSTRVNDCYFATSGEDQICRRCETPSTAVIAVSATIIVLSLVGFLLFQNSAVAIFVAEVLIAVLLLVLGLGEWWFFDVIVISTVLFLISRSATKYLGKRKQLRPQDNLLSAGDEIRDDAPVQDSHHKHREEEAAYFVGIIKVSIFFLQTTSAILPRGTWPRWVVGIIEALNSVSLRIAGIECFSDFFSVPAVRFATLMVAPIIVRHRSTLSLLLWPLRLFAPCRSFSLWGLLRLLQCCSRASL
jgi:hypothetical protein